jgi:hypothetical protein
VNTYDPADHIVYRHMAPDTDDRNRAQREDHASAPTHPRERNDRAARRG